MAAVLTSKTFKIPFYKTTFQKGDTILIMGPSYQIDSFYFDGSTWRLSNTHEVASSEDLTSVRINNDYLMFTIKGVVSTLSYKATFISGTTGINGNNDQ